MAWFSPMVGRRFSEGWLNLPDFRRMRALAMTVGGNIFPMVEVAARFAVPVLEGVHLPSGRGASYWGPGPLNSRPMASLKVSLFRTVRRGRSMMG